MRLRRSSLTLVSLLLLATGVGYMIWRDKRHLRRAEQAFISRCQREHARPADCARLADANHLDCWRLTYSSGGKAQPKPSFDPRAHYRCVLDPVAYKRMLAERAKKRRERRERHFIP